MRNRSLKRAKQEREYSKLRDKFLADNPICMFPECQSEQVELHHAAGRVGNLLTDVSTFRSLCRYHHQYVELHPDVAKEWNLSISRLEKRI
ncbi:MAG: hypothetical protein WC380_00145 [Pedobacter sp.]|jgi:hypothetical protein